MIYEVNSENCYVPCQDIPNLPDPPLTMTRVWSNGTKQEEETGGCSAPVTPSEADFNMKEAAKHQGENGQQARSEDRHTEEEEEEEKEEKEKKSFFGLCFSEDLEKELAEQSKVALKMIYFFQVLPFYILQFTSGMALGNIYIEY